MSDDGTKKFRLLEKKKFLYYIKLKLQYAISGPILINFFLNRLNFSRRTRISGLKIRRKNAKWLKSMPSSLKKVTYNTGLCASLWKLLNLLELLFNEFFFDPT